MKHREPPLILSLWIILIIAALSICSSAAVLSQPRPAETKPAPSTPTRSPKYAYTPREPIRGAYFFTTGHVQPNQDGWTSFPATEDDVVYTYGPTGEHRPTFTTTRPVTRITWVLPDGSQRVQEGDLTYYDPETGEQK